MIKKTLKWLKELNRQDARYQEYLRGIVPYSRWDECFEWAFGEGWGVMSVQNSPEAWNKRHSDLFTVYGHDDPAVITPKIGKEFMKAAA